MSYGHAAHIEQLNDERARRLVAQCDDADLAETLRGRRSVTRGRHTATANELRKLEQEIAALTAAIDRLDPPRPAEGATS